MDEVEFRAKANKGDKTFDVIAKMSRMFLPNIFERDNNLLCTAASVKPYHCRSNKAKKKKKVEKEEYFYEWHGFFSIRQGNNNVYLHNPECDPGLIHFENKLLLLKEKIDLFLKKIKEAEELAPEEDFNERTWLNPMEVEPNYTGYVFITVKKDGSGRLYVADCHRTINLFIDNWIGEDKKKTENPFNKPTIEFLETVSQQVVIAVELIKGVREQFLATISVEE